MHHIKKIILSFVAFYYSHNFAQEIRLPDDVWQPIVIDVLITHPRNAGDLLYVSWQLYKLISTKPEIVIKEALAKREHRIISHHETARRMRIPAITTPYISANERLLHTIELVVYQEGLRNSIYADINYEGKIRKNKLEMICSDLPTTKLNWIHWLTEHGARENNTHIIANTALGSIIHSALDCTKAQAVTYCSIVSKLLNAGANPSLHIHKAIDARCATMVKLLIDHGATIISHDYVWLRDYLMLGNIDEHALKFLLEQGYDPYTQGYRPVNPAEWGGRHYVQLENAIQAVGGAPHSPKRDRILDLLRQYPKEITTDGSTS